MALHYQAGYSYTETAEALGCPEGTVATRLASARERLKTALATAGVVLAAGVTLEGAAAASAPPIEPLSLSLTSALSRLTETLPAPPMPRMLTSTRPFVLGAAGILFLVAAVLGPHAPQGEPPKLIPPQAGTTPHP